MSSALNTQISSTNCVACSGAYSSLGANVGLSSTGAQNVCPCAPGYGRSSGTTSTPCLACTAGFFKNIDNDLSCSNCPAGTYMLNSLNTQTSNANCLSCAAGYTTTATGVSGASSQSACTVCDAGYGRSSNANACVICDAGKWKSTQTDTVCKNCIAGKIIYNKTIV